MSGAKSVKVTNIVRACPKIFHSSAIMKMHLDKKVTFEKDKHELYPKKKKRR